MFCPLEVVMKGLCSSALGLMFVLLIPFSAFAQQPAKVSKQLAALAIRGGKAQTVRATSSTGEEVTLEVTSGLMRNNLILFNAIAESDAAALALKLRALGAQRCMASGRVVSGWLPLSSISKLEGVTGLRFIRSSLALTNAGVVLTQGDQAQRSDIARTVYNLTGIGTKVGILSDSFNRLGGMAQAQATGELPGNIDILQDFPEGGDEGRAMAEIVHDVAPAASIAYHTAFDGVAGFAHGIRALADAGSRVIVDDVIYLEEPMFVDGVIAQAIDEVVSRGVSYFSSAGNAGRSSYQAPYLENGNGYHDFDTSSGSDTILEFHFLRGVVAHFSLQWVDNYASYGAANPGAATDLDIEFVKPDGTPFLDSQGHPIGGFETNTGLDPVETVSLTARSSDPSAAVVVGGFKIRKKSGPAPVLIKLLWYVNGAGQGEYLTNSATLFGHANSRGAIAVGAVQYCKTPVFGTTPAELASFSSAGGVPIYSKINEEWHTEVRQKPEIVAPQGTNNSFFGSDSDCDPASTDLYPNFYGTSAAAPHAAGIAALMLQKTPLLTSRQIRSVLSFTADDMKIPGFDFDSGWGLVRADAAVAALLVDADDDATNDIFDCAPNDRLKWRDQAYLDPDRDGVRNSAVLTETEECFGANAPGGFSLVENGLDNCPNTPNANQSDRDRDGIGDACDTQSGNPAAPQRLRVIPER